MLHHIRLLAGGKCEAQANNHQLCVECSPPSSLSTLISLQLINDYDGLDFLFMAYMTFLRFIYYGSRNINISPVNKNNYDGLDFLFIAYVTCQVLVVTKVRVFKFKKSGFSKG